MFPGAASYRDESSYERSSDTAGDSPSFVIIGAPLDISTSFRSGTRFGPDRLRTFARPFEDYDHRTDQHFSACGVFDYGDVRAWDDASAYLDYLEHTVRDVTVNEAIPLLLGGEHTISLAGVRAVDPDVFVCLDAHLDLRKEYDGNPLSHACVTRRVLEHVEEVVILGARAGASEEWKRAEHEDVTVVPPADVSTFPLTSVLDGRDWYLSVDIDSADPAYAPGTGTMEPFGLEPATMRDLVRTASPHVVGFDVVEVNDRDDGQAASLGAKLLREFVFEVSQ